MREGVPDKPTTAVSQRRRGALRPSVIVPTILLFIVVGAVLLWRIPEILLKNWLEGVNVDDSIVRLSLGSAAQIVLFALGGIIAIVGVGLSLSRHGLELDSNARDQAKEERRIQELAEERAIDAERELRTRFVNAVGLLSDPDRPTTRQAGVYALAALADDWSAFGRLDERQVCIDVLCGYLRSKWKRNSPNADAERSIRSAGFDVIGTHLRPEIDAPDWRGSRFNLRGALVDFDANLSGIDTENTIIDLTAARLAGGDLNFNRSRFVSGSLTFQESTLSGGRVMLTGSVFGGDVVSFAGATLAGSELFFRRSTFVDGAVDFTSLKLSDGSIRFMGAKFDGGTVDLSDTTLSGGSIDFRLANLSAGTIDFSGSRFSGGRVDFRRTRLRGSEFDFDGSSFAGSVFDFANATFVSGEVSFDNAQFTGGVLNFSRLARSTADVTFHNADFSGTTDLGGRVLSAPAPPAVFP